jgi:outer membrane protein TolC
LEEAMRVLVRPLAAALVLIVTVPSGAAETLRLAEVLAAVRARNPAVAERRQRAAAAKLRLRVASLPEDPMAMLEWWQQPVNFSFVPVMLTLKQTLPWRSRLSLRRGAAEAEARALDGDADEGELRALAEARRAFYDLVLAERSLAVNQMVEALLDKMVKTSDALYRVGKTVQADVLRAQAELLATQNQSYDLDRDRQVAAARLNALLDRNADSAVPPAESDVELTELAPERELTERALRERPAVRRAEAQLAAAKQRAGLARIEGRPELAVWTSFMVAFGGVDTFTVGVSSTLPFWGTVRQHAEARAADAEVRAAERALDDARRATESQVHATLLQAQAAARHVHLHADKLIPLADVTLQSALASYQAGRVPFTTVLDAARMVRDHHLNHLKFLVDHQKALADLSELTGGEP